MESFDVIVIGAGMAGSAAAWQLASDGLRVLLLEQFEIGHTRGSSHGESRIFRFAYPRPEYAKFAMQSKPLWLSLEKESGEKLLHSIGGLDFADDPECFDEVKQIASALRQNGAVCEELTAREIRKRYPQWRVSDSTIGVFSPDGGWIEAGKAVGAMIRQAVQKGAVVRDSELVLEIAPGESITVRTAREYYIAKSLVIAAGAWINNLLKYFETRIPLKVTQEQPVYFAPVANADCFRSDRFPIWIHYRKPFFTYGFPMLDTPGVKLAFHHHGREIDPIARDRIPDPEITRDLREYLREYLPDAAGEMVEEVTCLYTTTLDHNFVIDLLPNFPNVAVASPCSGHGFKFATGIGRALADLVQFGKTDLEIGQTRFFTKALKA